jgi:cell division protein FtsB
MVKEGSGLFRQVTEQTEQIEELQATNKSLRSENQRLQAENRSLNKRAETQDSTFEQRMEVAVAKAIACATQPLYERIRKLEEENERKDAEILRLKAQINRDSSNSSKPPSSNGFKVIPNNREKSERKTGGQKGHKGHTLTIPKNLKELADAGKVQHKIVDDANGSASYVSDWTIDLLLIPIYTERRRPKGTPPTIQYGETVQTLTVLLQNTGLMSVERIAEVLKLATEGRIALSEGTILSFRRKAAEGVDVESIIHDLLNGNVLHVDETPVKTTQRIDTNGTQEESEHTTMNAYVRTYSNDRTTLLTANAHKDEESVINDNILTRFCGILSHDHEAKFYKFGTKHATCHAHLSRELKGMRDPTVISQEGTKVLQW